MNVGDKIPEILGIDQDGREIKASDYRGRKIVLYSYPKANTSGCTAEACSLQAHKEELAAAGYDPFAGTRLLGREGNLRQKDHRNPPHHLSCQRRRRH